jgi:hypothetical protein
LKICGASYSLGRAAEGLEGSGGSRAEGVIGRCALRLVERVALIEIVVE